MTRRILSAIEHGDPQAAEQLLPLVYDELRKLAARRLAQEKPGQTLQATALVHEAYLRLVGADQAAGWDGRGHFFAAAAEAMRRILVENARRKRPAQARRRTGRGWTRRRRDRRRRAPDETCWPSTRRSTQLAAADPARPSWSSSATSPASPSSEAAGSSGSRPRTADRHLGLRPRLAPPRDRGEPAAGPPARKL